MSVTTSEDVKDVVSQYKPVSDIDEVMARASRRFEETLASTPAVAPRGQRSWKPAMLTVLAAAAVVAVAAGRWRVAAGRECAVGQGYSPKCISGDSAFENGWWTGHSEGAILHGR